MNLATVGHEILRAPEGERSHTLSGKLIERIRIQMQLEDSGISSGDFLPKDTPGFSYINPERLKKLTQRRMHELVV